MAVAVLVVRVLAAAAADPVVVMVVWGLLVLMARLQVLAEVRGRLVQRAVQLAIRAFTVMEVVAVG